MDMLISHFPEYVVYDFACGIYAYSIPSLWWALRVTILVSDRFNVGNNSSCSPIFMPTAHFLLDRRNPVADEQKEQGYKIVMPDAM